VTVLGIVMVMAGTVFAAAPARDFYINSHNCPNREADQGVPVMPVGILGNTVPPAIMVDATCISTEIKAINTKLKKIARGSHKGEGTCGIWVTKRKTDITRDQGGALSFVELPANAEIGKCGDAARGANCPTPAPTPEP